MNVENNAWLHRFEVGSGDDVAFLTYEIDGDTIALMHTKVPEQLSGRGIAGELAQAAFDFARGAEVARESHLPLRRQVARAASRATRHRRLDTAERRRLGSRTTTGCC